MKTKTLIVGLSLAVLSLGVLRGRSVEAPAAKPGSASAQQEAVQVHAHLDRPLLVKGGGEQEVVVKIQVTGGPAPDVATRRAPLNLAVVLDRSGSMTGAKLEKARQAAMMLIDQLSARDVVSLVIYDTEVQVLASARKVGNRQAELKRLIRNIQPGGSTALYAGVKTGGNQLEEFLEDEAINRVLLLSDGIANVGPKSNREIAQLGQRLAQRGMSVSTIGLGDDYNEDLMTALAESSDANYYFVDDVEMLSEVFERELGELKAVVARKIIVEITFPKGVRPLRFLGREDGFKNNAGTIRFGILAGEQSRDILIKCAVDPAVAAGDTGAAPIASVNLNYEDTLAGTERQLRCAVVAGLTDDADVAEDKVDSAVRAEAEFYANADVSRAALAQADAGDHEAAKKTIDSQIIRLRSAQTAAPQAQQQAFEREIGVLEENRDDLDKSGSLSSGGRKRLQWSIFNRGNAKKLDESP